MSTGGDVDLDEIDRAVDRIWKQLKEFEEPADASMVLVDLFLRLALSATGTQDEAGVRAALSLFEKSVITLWRLETGNKAQ
jgi:cytochrome c556